MASRTPRSGTSYQHRFLGAGRPHPSTLRSAFTIWWFDTWDRVLDEAVECLPVGDYPHEVHRLLCEQRSAATKQIALVTDHDSPIAVVGLRRRSPLQWEPVSTYLIPGTPFPVLVGREIDVLQSLGRDIFVAWWRIGTPPPEDRSIRSVRRTPTHRIATSEDFEAYWRQKSQLRTVRAARNRCKGLRMAVNEPGSAAWVMEGASRRWNTDGRPDLWLPDRLALSAYLESNGLQHTLLLADHDTPVGGATMVAHDNALVGTVNHRDTDYGRLGIGVRLTDWSFYYTAEQGFGWIDIGGGYEYKRKWAPETGCRWDLEVSTPWRHSAYRGVRAVGHFLKGPATRVLARLP